MVDLIKLQYKLQVETARESKKLEALPQNNGDFKKIPDYRGNFSKAFKHDQHGRVNREEYRKLIKGIIEGKSELFLDIKLGTPNGLKMMNPSHLSDLSLTGPHQSTYQLNKSPSILSRETIADIIEIYGFSLSRDVHFNQYSRSPIIQKVISGLEKLPVYRGPKIKGKNNNENNNLQITPKCVFRGKSRGDLRGPYLSQFLLYPTMIGSRIIEQKYYFPVPYEDFGTNLDEILSLRNGQIFEKPISMQEDQKYITTLRDGAYFIRTVDALQPYLDAISILYALNIPLCEGNPYVNNTITNEMPLLSFGKIDLYEILIKTSKAALSAAWFHKWNNLKLRPEELGIEIDRFLSKKDDIEPIRFSPELSSNPILKEIYQKNNSYLLPLSSPSGCPPSPAYPSVHATLAGAATTILKGWFSSDSLFPHSYVPSDDGSDVEEIDTQLSVADELDKLASNCSMFCCASGMNFRSDLEGLILGEQVAITILQEEVYKYQVPVKFEIVTRNDQIVVINNFDHFDQDALKSKPVHHTKKNKNETKNVNESKKESKNNTMKEFKKEIVKSTIPQTNHPQDKLGKDQKKEINLSTFNLPKTPTAKTPNPLTKPSPNTLIKPSPNSLTKPSSNPPTKPSPNPLTKPSPNPPTAKFPTAKTPNPPTAKTPNPPTKPSPRKLGNEQKKDDQEIKNERDIIRSGGFKNPFAHENPSWYASQEVRTSQISKKPWGNDKCVNTLENIQKKFDQFGKIDQELKKDNKRENQKKEFDNRRNQKKGKNVINKHLAPKNNKFTNPQNKGERSVHHITLTMDDAEIDFDEIISDTEDDSGYSTED